VIGNHRGDVSPVALLIQYISGRRTLPNGASDLFLMSSRCPILKGRGLYDGMVLKLASDEVQEVQRALSAAYVQLLRELSRVDGYPNRKEGLELCQRKWKLEALLHQLDHSDGPHPVLELVPAGQPRSLPQRSRLTSPIGAGAFRAGNQGE
jgi:hypothetical protein